MGLPSQPSLSASAHMHACPLPTYVTFIVPKHDYKTLRIPYSRSRVFSYWLEPGKPGTVGSEMNDKNPAVLRICYKSDEL